MTTQFNLALAQRLLKTLSVNQSQGSLASQAHDCFPIVEALGYYDLGDHLRVMARDEDAALSASTAAVETASARGFAEAVRRSRGTRRIMDVSESLDPSELRVTDEIPDPEPEPPSALLLWAVVDYVVTHADHRTRGDSQSMPALVEARRALLAAAGRDRARRVEKDM